MSAASPERKTSMEEAFALLAELRSNLQHQQIPEDEDHTGGTGFVQHIDVINGTHTTNSGSPREDGDSRPSVGGGSAQPRSSPNDRRTSPVNFSRETPRISTLKDQVEQLRRDKKALLSQLDAVEDKLKESQRSASPSRKHSDLAHVQPLVSFSNGNAEDPRYKNLPSKFVALQSRVSEAVNNAHHTPTGAALGHPPTGAHVTVWESTDVKLTDEKVMANLSRRYHLTLVGIPVPHHSSATEDSTGPRVKAATGGASRTSSPTVGAVVKRNVSPTASKRLVAPVPAVGVARKTTPSRAVGTPSTTPVASSRVTPVRTTAASKDVARKPTPTTTSRVTPLRRVSSPGVSVNGKTAPAGSAVGKKPADPKPVLRFTPAQGGTPDKTTAGAGAGSPMRTPVRKVTNSPTASKTRTGSPSASKTASSPAHGKDGPPPASQSAVPPALAISAALAQFKGISADETPRVPGDGKGPMPSRTAAPEAKSRATASPMRKTSNLAAGTTGSRSGTASRTSTTTASRTSTTTATRTSTTATRTSTTGSSTTTTAASRPGATASTRPKTVQGGFARGTLTSSTKPATTTPARR